MLVLAVELHQPCGEILQGAGGSQRAVDERAAAALRRNFTADEELFFAALEDRFNRGRVLAGAHELARRPAAEQQSDRLDQDGLPRSGLAGQHIEAGSEFDLDEIDDRQMPDAKEAEHEKWAA